MPVLGNGSRHSFQEDGMEERTTSLRHRIPTEKRQECLKLFEQGYGWETTPGHIEAV